MGSAYALLSRNNGQISVVTRSEDIQVAITNNRKLTTLASGEHWLKGSPPVSPEVHVFDMTVDQLDFAYGKFAATRSVITSIPGKKEILPTLSSSINANKMPESPVADNVKQQLWLNFSINSAALQGSSESLLETSGKGIYSKDNRLYIHINGYYWRFSYNDNYPAVGGIVSNTLDQYILVYLQNGIWDTLNIAPPEDRAADKLRGLVNDQSKSKSVNAYEPTFGDLAGTSLAGVYEGSAGGYYIYINNGYWPFKLVDNIDDFPPIGKIELGENSYSIV